MNCKTCNAEIEENAKFCPECGAKVETEPVCSNCGVKLDAGAKFCPECGTKTEKESVCSSCGIKLPAGIKFCPECGAKADAVIGNAITSDAVSSEAVTRDTSSGKAENLRVQDHLDNADDLWENNEYDKAITEYTYALEMKPENSEALLGRGDAYYFNEEYGKAIADYTRALEIDPDNTEALMWRGRAYSNNVEYGKALSDFKKALRFAEDVDDTGTIAEAYEDLGYTYYRDENYDKAILFFEKYIALGHRNDIVYMNCGQAHILNGYFDKGNEYLYRVTELDSDSEKAIEKFRNNAAENRAANGGSQSKRQIVITIPNDWKGVLEKLWDLKETNNSISFHTVKDAKKYFNFEPNHPVAMGAYAMSEIKPENYVSLSSFHNYCQSIKFKAFLELCASLGALEIYIESAEINNRKIDLQAGASKGLLGEFAGSYSSKKNASSGEVLAFTFSEENSVMQDYNTPWLESEPTWREMRDRRKMFFAKTFEVEFNYTNDYGINGDLSVKLLDCSLDIGGSFHEMTEVRIKYKVVFW